VVCRSSVENEGTVSSGLGDEAAEVTIHELGSLGELVAAIATLVTLLYLALQIRRNTQATRASSFHAISDSMNHVNVSVAQNPGLARVWLAGSADRSSLSEEERHRYDLVLLSYFHVFETMHYQARSGAGEKDLVAAEERSLRALLSTPGVREWWTENPYAFGVEFRAYVGRLVVADSTPPGTDDHDCT
jgi:hypothetical protein